DRPLRSAASLDPDEPRLSVGECRERLPHDGRLGARATDPTCDPPVRAHDRMVAGPGRRRAFDTHYGRQRERSPFRRESSGFDEHVHSARPTSFRAAQTRSGVTGISRFLTPAWASASTTALTYAAGEPTVADSPMPLAPSGWCGDGVTVSSSSNGGVSQAVGSR